MTEQSMDQEQFSYQATKHGVVAVATVLIVFLFVHFLVPQEVQKKLSLIAPKTELKNAGETNAVSEDLLAYVKQKRETANSASDQLEEDELFEAFKELQADYTDKADQIIANRFKFPEFENNPEADESFQVQEGLKEIVTFWTHVFGMFTRDHVVFYNEDNVGIVYSVLDFSETDGISSSSLRALKSQLIREEQNRIKGMLGRVAKVIKEQSDSKDPSFADLNPEEQRIARLAWAEKNNVDLSDKALQQSLKFRFGFSHRIRSAFVRAGRYLDEMKRIFRERGLPEELTTIPFVESAFDLNAYSRAGAAGIWQFIAATGQRYLRIDEYVDERYDPILAAYAAATHLSNEYKLLGRWDLTINAYNTGPGRMLQAIKRLNTKDMATIVKTFKGAGYGFDSRNYYPEIVAAYNVISNHEHYFGELSPKPLQKFEYVAMPNDLNIKELSRLAGVSVQTIADYNLGLKPAVVSGHLDLPRGYLLKIPPKVKDDVLLAMQELNKEILFASHHVAGRGDSLKKIARKYDVSIQELATLNGMLPKDDIKTGAVIKLPGRNAVEAIDEFSETNNMVMPDNIVNQNTNSIF